MRRRYVLVATIVVAVSHAVVTLSHATESAGSGGGDAEDVAKKLSNPVSDIVSVPLQFNWVNGNGPQQDLRFVMNFQPVVPFAISEKWALIGRWIMPYESQPASLGSATGLGDITASAFFSPRASSGLLWGAGPVFGLPTTSDPALGSGKWSVGPTAVVLKQTGGWSYGMLWNQLWSFASTSNVDRPDVNRGLFQPFLAHVSPKGVTVTLQSEAIANWTASSSDVWTIPINAQVSKVTHFGPFPLSVAGALGVFVVKPDGGPDWQLRTTFTLVLPGKK
ncbi:MAG TPA: hypothetical protein VFB89_06005 [Gemmatimonadales bacterium]|nr:hypothetical protein [Gemmatimonadales bacterium]